MWVRSAAIRPVPPFAQLPAQALEVAEDWLAGNDTLTDERLREAFERFEQNQPALAERMTRTLGRAQDEVAAALGYFLALALWLAFDEAFGDRVARLSDTELDGADQSLRLDEQLRGSDPVEAVDSDDVVAMEQPHAVRFIHEHVEAALESHAAIVDVDAVHRIYRTVLVEVLALSYAVAAPEDFAGDPNEVCA